MKTKIFTLLILSLISGMVFSQNLLQNGSFELPASTATYRADCFNNLCFNGNVPNWFIDPKCTNTGVESTTTSPFGPRMGFSYNKDNGATCQVVGLIDAYSRTYAISFYTSMLWHNSPSDTAMITTYFYSYQGTDSLTRKTLDIHQYMDSTTILNKQSETKWHNHSYTFTVPESEIAKKLVIGFKVIGFNAKKLYGASDIWIGFDNFLLTRNETTTGIDNQKIEQNLFDVYPNPSNGLFNVICSKNSEIEVYDLFGRVLLSKSSQGNDIIDLSGKNKGMYFLQVKTADNKVQASKLLVK